MFFPWFTSSCTASVLSHFKKSFIFWVSLLKAFYDFQMTWESGFTCTDPVRAFLHWGLPHTRITWDIQILNQHIIKHKCQPHSKSAMQSKPLAASDVTNFLGAIKTHPPVLVCISPEELTPFESVLKKNYLLTSHIPHFMINNVFNKGLHLWFIHQGASFIFKFFNIHVFGRG